MKSYPGLEARNRRYSETSLPKQEKEARASVTTDLHQEPINNQLISGCQAVRRMSESDIDRLGNGLLLDKALGKVVNHLRPQQLTLVKEGECIVGWLPASSPNVQDKKLPPIERSGGAVELLDNVERLQVLGDQIMTHQDFKAQMIAENPDHDITFC